MRAIFHNAMIAFQTVLLCQEVAEPIREKVDMSSHLMS
jgi:hypothetical protein